MPYYPQPVTVKDAGTPVGTQPSINFIEGTNITLTITDDATNNEVDVEIAASGGGGTPAGSDTQIQYNSSGAFGANAHLRAGPGGVSGDILLGQPGFAGAIVASDGDAGNLNGSLLYVRSGLPFDDGIGTAADGGAVNLSARDGVNGGNGGALELVPGQGIGSGDGGLLYISSGYADSGNAGNIEIDIGTSTSGTNGLLIIYNLPTADPGVSGALWINGTVLEVSP